MNRTDHKCPHTSKPICAQGLCAACYGAKLRWDEHHSPRQASRTCQHHERPYKARGMCHACYAAFLNARPKGGERRLWFRAKQSARLRGWEFTIQLEDLKVPDVCPILGIKLDWADRAHGPNKPSVDRIDNAKGYVPGNVWVISWRANELKADATLDELRAMVRALELQSQKQFRARSHAWFTRKAA